MHRLIRFLVALTFLFSCSSSWATPWAVVANSGTGGTPTDPDFESEAIYTLDLGTVPATVHGPFLEGQLVPTDPVTGKPQYGGGMFDIAYIPGTNDALISNFGAEIIYRINFDNPVSPKLVGSLKLDNGLPDTDPKYKSMFAEDIAITSDGTLAIVSDGGFCSTIAFINLHTFTVSSLFELYDGVPFDPLNPPAVLPPLNYANAVAITPDNQTVIMADYFSSTAIYGKINSAKNGLEEVKKIHLCPNWDPIGEKCGANDYPAQPVNVAISPDGKTALLANAGWGMLSVLKITGPETVEPGTPFQLWGLPDSYADYLADEALLSPIGGLGSSQSIVFAPDGQKAYVLQNGCYASTSYKKASDPMQNQLSWVRINGPGQVSVGGLFAAMLHSKSTSQLFGVDTLTITKEGTNIFTSNPTLSGGSKIISRVNLEDLSTSAVNVNSTVPVGIELLGHKFAWAMFMPAITHEAAH